MGFPVIGWFPFAASVSPLVLLLVGAPLNCLAGLAAFWRKSVTPGGALAGAGLGTAVFIAGGPLAWVVLAVFVLSSTGFTRFRAREKAWLASVQEKGGRRDAVQVIANGGVGLVAAVLLRFTGAPLFAVAFAAAFASANADTWASEIGVLSRRQPFSLPGFRRVPRGVSGGMTLLGCAASVCGALCVALVFALENALVTGIPAGAAGLVGLVAAAGVFGSVVDSILGSTLQAQYTGADLAPTERRVTAGAVNRLARGLPCVTNDVVNLLSTAAAAIAGALLSGLLRGSGG